MLKSEFLGLLTKYCENIMIYFKSRVSIDECGVSGT